MINDETQETVLENTEEVETEVETGEVQETDTTDWKAEALKYKAILDRNKSKKEEHTEVETKTNSGEFGYDVKAYLKASGIKAEEFDFVKKELKQFGGDIDSLIDNEYFQAKLEKQRSLKATEQALPKSKRSGSQALDSVDYWLTKPFAEVPLEMRHKVLNAKLDKDKKGTMFYNS